MIKLLLPFLLLINYADLKISPNKLLIDLEEGGPVDLQCKPEQTGTPEVKWFKVIDTSGTTQQIYEKDEKYKIFADNYTLRIEDPKRNTDEADYVCLVEVGGSSENATIKVRGKPEFTTFKAREHTKDVDSFNVVEMDDLQLICEVVLKPLFSKDNITFRWLRKFPNNTEEKIEGLNITEGEELDGRSNVVKKSLLFLDDVKYTDRAHYICEASNSNGDNGNVIKANSTVNVRVKDKLGALWPFLGIVGEVVILCTIICIYEKKRNKPEFEESENNSDGKSGTHSKMSR